MKIAFVTECDFTVTDEDVADCGLLLFPFYYDGVVSYNKEIKGDTRFFKTLTNLSKCLKTTVIAGVDTDSCGMIRHSAAVCDGGKLIGISDMVVVRDGENYLGGGTLRVYDTKAGSLGVVVGEDVFSSECIRTLTLCGADLIVCVADAVTDGSYCLNARAKAYEFGVPIAVCANKTAMLADINGEMVFASPKKITHATVNVERDYHLITLRRRGRKRRS